MTDRLLLHPVSPASAGSSTLLSEAALGDRFQIVRVLKADHAIDTYLGIDRSDQSSVIIKTIRQAALTAGARMRLEHEASLLARLRHLGYAPVLHFGRDGDRLWLVSAFVPGVCLADRLQHGPLSAQDALVIGTGLVQALRDAHQHGVLHRDVRPSNIILREGKALQAVLVDFGLSRNITLEAYVHDRPAGTARYVSPEQAGLLDHGVDERSDLYSAGVVLFECLAGRPPFQGDTLGEVLRQQLTARPPELRSLGLAVPRALDEVIQRLLRKDPRERYHSAEAVASDLATIATALKCGVAEPNLVVGLSDRRHVLTEPAFVGRVSELAALDVALAQAAAGHGGLVLLEAESGGGKSRLLTEFAQRSTRRSALVLRGQGQSHAAQRPFQILVGVADGLLDAINHDPRFGDTVRHRLGQHAAAVGAAFPELAVALDLSGQAALGPESFGETRTLEALVRLLEAIGSARRPVLVILDDSQWADDLTLKLLQRWRQRSRHGAVPDRHVLLVVAFRSEEVGAEHPLRAVHASCRVALSAFGAADVRQLTESMAGPLPAEVVDTVVQLAHGSPFMAAAVLQGLVESGALVPDPSGWRAEATALQHVQSSRHAAAFLAHRLTLLPPEVASLLAAGAVQGNAFDLELAAMLADQVPAVAIAAADEARRRHMLWVQDTRCAFVHDKLRETVLRQLTDGARKDLHWRTALHLEGRPHRNSFDLAYHFDAAGHSDLALPYALEAAEQARSQHALESAEQQYRIAERGLDGVDEATCLRVAQGLGDVLMLRGQYREAAAQFQKARQLAHGRQAEARIVGRLGELAFKCGEAEMAQASLEQALRLLGRLVPGSSFTVFVLVLWEILVQVCHSLAPRLFLGRRSLEHAADDRLVMRLYSRLAHLYWFHRGTLPCLWAHLREMNLAERYPPTPELAQAYSEHAPVMSLVPYFSRGIAYAKQSLAIRRTLADLWGQGQSLNFYGVILYASSQFDACIKKCREAVRLLERTGDHWEVHIARFQVAASLYRLGDLPGALAEARRIHERGLEVGDAQASGLALDIWARATGGNVPAALIETELARPQHDVQRTAQILLAKAVHLLGVGQPLEAAECLERARTLLQNTGVRNAWVAPILPWLATAWREAAVRSSALTPGRRREFLRNALRAAKQSRRRGRCFPNEMPHTLRELALLAAMRGQRRQASRYFRESKVVAHRQKARYELARTQYAEAQVSVEFGQPRAAEKLEAAQRELQKLEAAVRGPQPSSETAERGATLSLADRFDTLLDVGRRLTAALSREAIVMIVQDAALRLLRGEHCSVLDLRSTVDAEVEVDLNSRGGPLNAALVKRVLEAGRAIAAVAGTPGSDTDELALAGVRSVLCAPILVRGRPAACLLVTHQQVSGLFGPDEERLADFVTALAGAALENAEGFAELRRLNETLQREMAERHEAEKQVHEQAALLDKAQDAIMVLNDQEHILYWNRSAERLYGWSAVEARGKNAAQLLFNKATPQHDLALRAVAEKGEWAGELSQVTRQGKEIIVESRWTLVRDDRGEPLSKLIVNTDVTDKRRLEANLLRAQRTESLGTLAGGIAHDINNVLTPIVMGIDLLKMGLTDSPYLPLLSDMETSAQRGTEMVRQILSFARGGVEGQKTHVRLQSVVVDIEKMVRRTFPKTVKVETSVAPDLQLVWGDPTQLYQIIMNLCVNARDAMPDGGLLAIEVSNATVTAEAARLHPDAQAGMYVMLAVTDTGTGIPSEIMARIFDPFFTTKEQGKGTGLGLATVHGIVKGHGGFLNVSSEVGVGTRFVVYLPAVALEAVQAATNSTRALPKGNGQTILVVDDEPEITQTTKQTLETHGYRVLTASDGSEAVGLYAKHRQEITALLMDMMMPVMDGPSTIRALRDIEPGVRVIASSGLTPVALPTEMFPDNVRAFLAKPYTAETLLNTVHTVIASSAKACGVA